MTKRTNKNCLGKVYHYLKTHKKGTMKQLVTNTKCSERYVQTIILELIEKDIIGKYRSFMDARVRIYYFKDKVSTRPNLEELQNKAMKDFHDEITKLNLQFPSIKFTGINHGEQIALYCYRDNKRNLLFLAEDYIRANRKIIDMAIILTAIFG